MFLVIAALAEELLIARKLASQGIDFLKCGVGPRTAAMNLGRFLKTHAVSHILAFGYAGALDPDLKVGDLVAVRGAASIGENVAPLTPLDQMQIEGRWELDTGDLGHLGARCRGDVLTSPFIIGEPEQKKLLRAKFQACAVDMETAAFARVASAARVPFAAVRVITDEVEDTFLAPLSYPCSTLAGRAVKIASAGHWLRRYKDWTERASIARESLRGFFATFEGQSPLSLFSQS